MRVINKTALNQVEETTISSPISVRYAKRVTFYFKREDHVSGSVVFRIQASVDGENFVPTVNMIKNSPNNHSQTLGRIISVQLLADGNEVAALDLEHFNYDSIKVAATIDGSGKSTCKMIIVE